ncbi:class I SAM-dependent methyltransferase [Paenibacillus piri]|uniref:Class I SAM-dependent methyltransferase n=1 Tax=Paenibacillus piri TaxID=2547395 RepID=A0A4R5KGB7_9BACL|nr:class I SAM-dependent methyltransferase [Paenibacillus piri]TDF93745.1 class I SAM-dependent methyltransferase [Paenibacillus piri]
MDVKREVQKQFGQNALKYVSSPIHAQGHDLAMLLEVAEADSNMRLLDVATGGGHVAKLFAPVVKQVTAFDLTAEMLGEAQSFIAQSGFDNVDFVHGDAEQLPFADGEFDRVACRIAAHHFPNVGAFASEAARVLRPGGCLLLIDNVAPERAEYDQFYNEVEKERDPSHYRAWKKSEWIRLVEHAGLTVELLTSFPKTFGFQSWADRMNMTETAKQRLEQTFLQATPELKRQFAIVEREGRLASFQGQAILLKARKAEDLQG